MPLFRAQKMIESGESCVGTTVILIQALALRLARGMAAVPSDK